jgi:peptidoglycan/LPS O-acetylase OafA/YrhL
VEQGTEFDTVVVDDPPADHSGAGRTVVDPPVRRPHHFACFDGLRAIAAVSVLLLHTAWISGFTERSSLGAYTSRLEIGVSVFFLISGFLLYRPFAVSHLSGHPRPNARRFWERRLLRIVPAYWLALTVLTYGFHVITLGPGWQGVAIHYLFLQIYFPAAIITGITQAWSLCTEMTFYLFLPLYAWLVGLRRRSQTSQLVRELAGVVVLYGVSLAFRYWALNLPLITVKNGKFVALCSPHCLTDPTYATLLPSWLPSYLDLFALGMLLAIVSAWFTERQTEPRWLQSRMMPWISWAGAALAFVAVSHVVTDHSILDFTTVRVDMEKQALYGLFAFCLLLPAVFGPQDRSLIRRLLRSWPMVSLGVISYGIYIWHLDLAQELLNWTGWKPGGEPFWQLAGAVLALSIAFASVSYFGLERPILRRKNRIGWWSRDPSPPAVLSAEADTGSRLTDGTNTAGTPSEPSSRLVTPVDGSGHPEANGRRH